MKTGEKIKLKMKEKGIKSTIALYRIMKSAFDRETMTPPTLYRIINNHINKPRLKNVSQIATVLNCLTSEFYQERSDEVPGTYKLYDFVNKGSGRRRRCFVQIVNLNDDLPTHPKKILLKFGGKTPIEQEKVSIIRWIFVYNGEMILHLLKDTGEEKIALSYPQHYAFDASIPHYYEGRSTKGGCQLIRINNPQALSTV